MTNGHVTRRSWDDVPVKVLIALMRTANQYGWHLRFERDKNDKIIDAYMAQDNDDEG